MVKMLNNAKKIKLNTFFSQICQFIISVFQKISESENFIAKLISKILIDNRKGVFYVVHCHPHTLKIKVNYHCI